MKRLLLLLFLVAFAGCVGFQSASRAQVAVPITSFGRGGSNTIMQFQPQPGIDSYTIQSTPSLSSAFAPNTNFSLLPTGQPEFVIDNTTATIVGTWVTGTTATDRFGVDYKYKNGVAAGTSYLQFTPNLPMAGNYDVYTWYSQGSNRNTNVSYVIAYNGGPATVHINQESGGGGWISLGRYNFNAGNSGYVRVTDTSPDTDQVLADAVRFVGVGLPIDSTNVLTPQSYEWRAREPGLQNFYRVQGNPMTSNAVVNATVLNRLAYGPTPDDLENIAITGPDYFITNQLAFEFLTETVTNSHTNIAAIETKFVYPSNVIDLYIASYTYTTNTNAVYVTNSSVVTTNYVVAVSTNANYASTNATIADLKAWHVLRAVGAKRQLMEILLQFLENHFVTQYSKSVTFMNSFYNGDDGVMEDRQSAAFELWENDRWRKALLDPQCTFLDLLKISAESPAMIIYLDTTGSDGRKNKIPNENYARELMELFTMGVDNGYDQNDITIMSHCWTGWRVDQVATNQVGNPFAAPLGGVRSNNVGVWAFTYQSTFQDTNSQTIFPNKSVPARFGKPWGEASYQLDVPKRNGTNGIQNGYQVITHLANLPFTEEFISVKLCRLFVHDNFQHGVYDYTDPNMSDEARLVHDCMVTWENSVPKGQIRPILQTIFNSSLFRSQAAAAQKVKTPLEYCVSAIRALRSSTNGTHLPGSYSSDTDGYSISGSSIGTLNYPLNRMGGMLLFDRNDPNGYPEDALGWISGGTLAERIRYVQSYLMANSDSGKSDSISGGNKNLADPMALVRLKLPSTGWTNATAVVNYFLGVIYPGEGQGNLALYQKAAINFLNTGDEGVNSSPFSALTPDAADTRVRGMVAMLMSFQRFNEQ